MQPDNVLMGDVPDAIDLPQKAPDPRDLARERAMTRYSKTAEFKEIQKWCQDRIDFYQTYLPDGRPIEGAADVELSETWRVANGIIRELKSLMGMYELATSVVEKAAEDEGL